MKIIEGHLTATGYTFGIAVSRFNSLVTSQLLDSALDCLRRHGGSDKDITVVYSPGSFELPLVALQMAQSRLYSGILCLGCIIRGETPHFDYIAAEAAKGIAQVGLSTGVPISFGVLTTDNLSQALERAGAKAGNKGWHAALSLLELINVSKQLSGGKTSQ